MEELKVDEYVRTKEGYIARFIHYGINEGINGKSCLFDKAIRDISCLIYDEDNFLFDSELKKYIVKHSLDIIDLIEEGDYVNGNRIGYIDDLQGAMRQYYYDYENPNEDGGHWEEEIKDVVTKEQFNQMKYIVGDE